MRAAFVVAALAAAVAGAAEGEWIEFYDKASNKKAYYHSITRESAWDPPEGQPVRYMSEEQFSSAKSGSTLNKGGNDITVLTVIIMPIVLVFVGLLVLYHMASNATRAL